jgi:hypothetical protein
MNVARLHTSGLLSQKGLSDMPSDHTLSGRMERRLPIIVVVSLKRTERDGTYGEERTYTDNISAHGARVFSKQPQQPGDDVTITPINEETTCGKVVYCQRLADDRYSIGVKFQDCHVAWSVVRKYDGVQVGPLAKLMSS